MNKFKENCNTNYVMTYHKHGNFTFRKKKKVYKLFIPSVYNVLQFFFKGNQNMYEFILLCLLLGIQTRAATCLLYLLNICLLF